MSFTDPARRYHPSRRTLPCCGGFADEHFDWCWKNTPLARSMFPDCWCGTANERLGCHAHGPQPRDHQVPCIHCAGPTWNWSAECNACLDTIEALDAQFGGAA